MKRISRFLTTSFLVLAVAAGTGFAFQQEDTTKNQTGTMTGKKTAMSSQRKQSASRKAHKHRKTKKSARKSAAK